MHSFPFQLEKKTKTSFYSCRVNNIHLVLLQIYMNSSTLCHNIVQRSELHRYADDILLVGQEEQEVASVLEAWVRPMHSSGWYNSPVEIQRLATSVTV